MDKGLIVLFLAAGAAFAGPIVTVISVSGATDPSVNQYLMGSNLFTTYAEVGWLTGSTAYSNVTITADLESYADDDDLIAYLTATIGPGTTSAVDTSPTIDVNSSGDYAEITLFTGISLQANTQYYLTLAPDDAGQYGWAIVSPTISTDGSTTYSGAEYCTQDVSDCANYPPASSGFTGGDEFAPDALVFSVTGTVAASATPEPATWSLVGTALAFGTLFAVEVHDGPTRPGNVNFSGKFPQSY